MKLHLIQSLVIVIYLSISQVGYSQNNPKEKSITPPDWVKAIDDPAANYYKAVKAYNDFWIGKEKPEDEEHLMNKGTETVKDHTKKLSKKAIRQLRLQDYYRYQCKRFENWMYVNKPYVQKDGHILSADERLKLWQQTQKDK